MWIFLASLNLYAYLVGTEEWLIPLNLTLALAASLMAITEAIKGRSKVMTNDTCQSCGCDYDSHDDDGLTSPCTACDGCGGWAD